MLAKQNDGERVPSHVEMADNDGNKLKNAEHREDNFQDVAKQNDVELVPSQVEMSVLEDRDGNKLKKSECREDNFQDVVEQNNVELVPRHVEMADNDGNKLKKAEHREDNSQDVAEQNDVEPMPSYVEMPVLENSDRSKLKKAEHREENFRNVAKQNDVELMPSHVEMSGVVDLTNDAPENAVDSELMCIARTQAVTFAGGHVERSHGHKSKLIGRYAADESVYKSMELAVEADSHCEAYLFKQTFDLKSSVKREKLQQRLSKSKYNKLQWKWELSATSAVANMKGQLLHKNSSTFRGTKKELESIFDGNNQLNVRNELLTSQSTEQLDRQNKRWQDRRVKQLVLTVKCDQMNIPFSAFIMLLVFVKAATTSAKQMQKFMEQNANICSKIQQNVIWKYTENTSYSYNSVKAIRKGPPWKLFTESAVQLRIDDSIPISFE